MTDLLSKEVVQNLLTQTEKDGFQALSSALRELLQRREAAEKAIARWCPDYCQITGRELFLWIEHPTLGYVPTYGGPYDSYTLPERDADGEFFVHRYDHDEGAWVDDEVLSFQVVDDWLPKNQAELDQYVKDNALTSAERERLTELEKLYAAAEEECAALRFKHCPVNAAYFRDEASRLEKELTAVTERLAAYDRAAKEPVAWQWFYLKQWHVTNDEERARDVAWGNVEVLPLFTTPPLPVVPDAMRESLYKIANHIAGTKGGLPTEWQDWAEEIETDIRRAATLQSGNYPVIPEGWVLVPENLTTEMRNAWDSAPMSDDDSQNMRDAYRAMLYAAPRPGKGE